MPNFSEESRRRRSIYLLPNVFTTANLFAGFYAVVQAINGRFEIAAIAIFVAMIFDGMDGRVARLTNTQSAFGEQYDSLSDMTSFGIAPALVMYQWVLQDLGRWGWLAAFIYVVGAALRLARFNTNIAVVDKRFFQGLPSPAAAALLAGFIWVAIDNRLQFGSATISWLAFVITVYAGIAMVTNTPFYSGKSFALGHSVPFWVMLVLVAVFVFVSSDPPLMLFGLFMIYGLSGWGIMLWRWRRARQLSRMRQEGAGEAAASADPAPHTIDATRGDDPDHRP
ncbi:CDP-diacylglycerol--serine O-phosphatidyltransferase [Pusillimonas sp.]|uniref:CDP-diacylglycerol--serine O-phosphatidyltransferase n=1 Tax=Pusillimonas sp. TaxID=3040095 RepID=UPI0037C824A3